jgi:hypothetical protein
MHKPKLTQTQARRLLTLYHASGLSQPAFCQKHRVGPSLFSYWPRRLRPIAAAAPAAPRFQEVILPPAILPKDTCLLSLPSGAKLEFPGVLLRDTLAWLTAKEAAC